MPRQLAVFEKQILCRLQAYDRKETKIGEQTYRTIPEQPLRVIQQVVRDRSRDNFPHSTIRAKVIEGLFCRIRSKS